MRYGGAPAAALGDDHEDKATKRGPGKEPPKIQTVLRVFAYLRRYPLLAAATFACAVTGTLLVVVFPAITQLVIDRAIKGGESHLLLPLVLTGVASFLVHDLLNAARIVLNNSFEQKVIFDLRSDIYAHIQRLPLAWFDNRATGDLMTRIVDDVNSVERVLIDGIEQGSVAVLQIGIVAAMLFHYNAGLAVLALFPIPLLACGALLYTTTARGRYRMQRRAVSRMNALLHDNISGIRQIKAFTREESEHARFNEVSAEVRRSTLRVMFAWALYSPSMAFFASLGLAVVLYGGGRAVLEGQMKIGELVAFLTLVRFLYEPVGRLHQLNQILQAGRAAGERVFELLDEPPEPGFEDCASAPIEARLGGEIEFRNVSFSYGTIPALSDVSFHVPPGCIVALAGPTGAGKSTLVNLITRFYELDKGEILFDGRPIKTIPKQALRRDIGIVTQESFLFNGTLRENLLLGDPTAAEERLWEALEAANAAKFVRGLPSGLETNVGERGVKLSVGEKQRISIARVLLKNPPVLILDEATASVDNATERAIQSALDRLMKGRTCFIIAHRLSTIRNADIIHVIERGRIVESGNHDILLAKGGIYARLWNSSTLAADPTHLPWSEP